MEGRDRKRPEYVAASDRARASASGGVPDRRCTLASSKRWANSAAITCSSRTPLRTVTPIETVDEATSTHGMRVKHAPRRAILATGVAMPTKRLIASSVAATSWSTSWRLRLGSRRHGGVRGEQAVECLANDVSCRALEDPRYRQERLVSLLCAATRRPRLPYVPRWELRSEGRPHLGVVGPRGRVTRDPPAHARDGCSKRSDTPEHEQPVAKPVTFLDAGGRRRCRGLRPSRAPSCGASDRWRATSRCRRPRHPS